MSTKIKKEELKNVSGGNGDVVTYTCRSPKCGKKFTSKEAVRHGFDVYCPYCGKFCDTLAD